MTKRLQHKTRRDGTITVGSTIYDLDADGVVEVTDEHAGFMLQGAHWREEGKWAAWERTVVDTTPQIVHGARRPRTRAELLGLADAEGVQGASEALAAELQGRPPSVHPEPILAPTTAPETPSAKAAAEEAAPAAEEVKELTVSDKMTKPELVEVAGQLGIEGADKMTKAQILDAIEAQSSDDDEEE